MQRRTYFEECDREEATGNGIYAVFVYRYTPKTLYDLYVTVREISSRLIESTTGTYS